MPDAELYHATRGIWKLGPRRERAKYALAVFHGLVREVYAIEAWAPAGTTRDDSGRQRKPGPKQRGRWEFTGRVAPPSVRKRYVGRSVAGYFKQGSHRARWCTWGAAYSPGCCGETRMRPGSTTANRPLSVSPWVRTKLSTASAAACRAVAGKRTRITP